MAQPRFIPIDETRARITFTLPDSVELPCTIRIRPTGAEIITGSKEQVAVARAQKLEHNDCDFVVEDNALKVLQTKGSRRLQVQITAENPLPGSTFVISY